MPYRDPEKKKERDRRYRLNNKEKIKIAKKKHRNSPNGIKQNRISNWKRTPPSGGFPLICDDYDLMYEHYINTEYCENPECKVKLTEDRYNTSTTKVLDHCHKTGNFRFILCNNCNVIGLFKQNN